MSISPINHIPAFKGRILVFANKGSLSSFDTDRIKRIEASYNTQERESVIEYKNQGQDKITRHYLRSDVNTVLNAYNAAKNSDLTVDITGTM